MARLRVILAVVTVTVFASIAGTPAGGAFAATGLHAPQAADPGRVTAWPENETTTDAATATDTPTANVTIHDQAVSVNASNASVLVASVTLPDGGFVSIQDAIGATLGHTGYLEPGTYENVTVTVNESLEPGQLVVAVVLRDSARGTVTSNREYDVAETGSEEDNPYFVNGTLVADTARVTATANGSATTTTE